MVYFVQKDKEDQRKREEEERKMREENERFGKWKSTKAPDFEENIIVAAANGKLTSIIYLLANGTNVNERSPILDTYNGWLMFKSTPLHWAAQYGHLSVVEYLVYQKADINAQSSGYPSGTPLHLAAHNGHLSVVEYLVNQKADINAKDNICRTPLHYAAENDHLSVVEYLVNQKADINANNNSVVFFCLI